MRWRRGWSPPWRPATGWLRPTPPVRQELRLVLVVGQSAGSTSSKARRRTRIRRATYGTARPPPPNRRRRVPQRLERPHRGRLAARHHDETRRPRARRRRLTRWRPVSRSAAAAARTPAPPNRSIDAPRSRPVIRRQAPMAPRRNPFERNRRVRPATPHTAVAAAETAAVKPGSRHRLPSRRIQLGTRHRHRGGHDTHGLCQRGRGGSGHRRRRPPILNAHGVRL